MEQDKNNRKQNYVEHKQFIIKKNNKITFTYPLSLVSICQM